MPAALGQNRPALDPSSGVQMKAENLQTFGRRLSRLNESVGESDDSAPETFRQQDSE